MYKVFKLDTIKTFTRKTVGSIALAIGILGLPISILYFLLVNPVSLLSPIFPIASSPFGLEFYITQVMVQNSLNIFASQLILTTSILSVLLLMGAGLLALELWRGIKSFGRGIKASPMAIVRSPMNAYRKVTSWRNWVLAKVNYLNEESAKWKMTFNIVKAPYSFLRMMGLSPQMAIGLLTATTVAGSGVVVNETVFAERSFARGDSGVYAASVIGTNLPLDVPTEYVDGSNTLRIDLGSTPVREITIENVSVGTVFTGSALPSGEANVVQISGNTVSGGTNTRLEIGHLIFENSRCKKLTLTDIQAHTLIVKGNASDGQSIAPSPGTSRMRAIGGGPQQADAMITSGGTYDRIWIQAPTSAVNGKVGTLRVSNLYTKGGDCVLSKMNVGTMEILLNEIGMGNGFATKEFSIATSVTAANITIEDNVEVTIAEPATN